VCIPPTHPPTYPLTHSHLNIAPHEQPTTTEPPPPNNPPTNDAHGAAATHMGRQRRPRDGVSACFCERRLSESDGERRQAASGKRRAASGRGDRHGRRAATGTGGERHALAEWRWQRRWACEAGPPTHPPTYPLTHSHLIIASHEQPTTTEQPTHPPTTHVSVRVGERRACEQHRHVRRVQVR
jgi:hypothetical protein